MDLTNLIDEVEEGCKEAFIKSYKNNSGDQTEFEKDLSSELDFHLQWFKRTVLIPKLMKLYNKNGEDTFDEYLVDLKIIESMQENYYGI